ncbi:MAG: hypothetical protein AB1512_08105 [Thermodesulfobacteriota bacterium]
MILRECTIDEENGVTGEVGKTPLAVLGRGMERLLPGHRIRGEAKGDRDVVAYTLWAMEGIPNVELGGFSGFPIRLSVTL